MKRLISLILTVSLILSVALCVSGCEETERVAFFTGDKANFILIRSNKAEQDTMDAAAYFRQAIIDTHNIKVTYKTDETKIDKEQYEVNIGVTNRPRSKKIYEDLLSGENNQKDYAIVFEDNIVYIVGTTAKSLQKAVEAFLSSFCAKKTSTIPVGFKYYYHFDPANLKLRLAGQKDYKKFKIVIPQYNMSYVIGREVDTLVEQYTDATGYAIKKETDNVKATEYEIVIGETNRGYAPLPMNTDEFIIEAKDNKVYINGADEVGTAMAVKVFGQMLLEEKNIDKNFNYVGSIDYSKKQFSKNEVYSLTWNDEFDTLDTSIWKCSTSKYPKLAFDGKEIYMSTEEKNLKVEDGKLVMRADNLDGKYTGSEIRTERSVWFKYGIIEISFKYHNTDGLCSAFWLLGRPGATEVESEIDIHESYAFPNKLRSTSLAHAADWSNRFSSDIDYGNLQPSQEEVKDINSDFYKKVFYELPDGDTFDDDWHTLGVEWNEEGVKWVVDGQVFLEISTTTNERTNLALHNYMQIILTQYSAVNVFPKIQKNVSENTDWENNHFTIEHLRLYQLPSHSLEKYY